MQELVAVLDSGSLYTKVGFAADEEPHAVFKTAVRDDAGLTKEYRFPIDRGVVIDWDTMRRVWHRVSILWPTLVSLLASQHPPLHLHLISQCDRIPIAHHIPISSASLISNRRSSKSYNITQKICI